MSDLTKLWRLAIAALALVGIAACSPPQSSGPSKDAKPIQVKAIVIANFEPGDDKGDAPGEFQTWVEREKLDETIPIRGAMRPLRRNAKGLYGIVWGDTGSMMGGAPEQLAALVLDPRFDFSKTYWLFTGISGTDPKLASVGSAAWARWVVQADAMREFDDREVPKDWPYGLFAIGAERPGELPGDPNSFGGITDVTKLNMALKLNQGLAQWAYDRTKAIEIPDSPQLQKLRAAWKGYPNAQRPPFVFMGETLGALRYWHGPGRTQWARDWVKMWTGGKGVFAMSNMESQSLAGAMNVLSKSGLVDLNRVMVLRTASNFTTPPPGMSAAESVGDEGPGQLGAYEANYVIGAPVLHELLDHWDQYENNIPSAESK